MGVHRTKQEKIAAHIRREQTYQWSGDTTTATVKKAAVTSQKSDALLAKEIPSVHSIRTDILRTIISIVVIAVIITIAFLKIGK